MKRLLVLLFVILMHGIYAECSDNQIDINSAALEKLDELTGIGPVKAQSIIDSRPFGSVDDLIEVYGIGEVTLKKIKEQGLACVDEEKVEENEEVQEEKQEEINVSRAENKTIPTLEVTQTSSEENKPLEIINLNAKDIKTKVDEEIKEETGRESYPLYGLVVFCFLLGFLFVIRRKKYKNEFD